MKNRIQRTVETKGACTMLVRGITSYVSLDSLDVHTVTIKVASVSETAYLMEGLSSGSLRFQVVSGEPPVANEMP